MMPKVPMSDTGTTTLGMNVSADSVREVERALLISIALVILVVFFFLRNLRTTFNPSVVVPVSLIGTFGHMYLLVQRGQPVANGSGDFNRIVVDDAIVVIENKPLYRTRHENQFQAALKGAQEIGFTVIAISMSLWAGIHSVVRCKGLVAACFANAVTAVSGDRRLCDCFATATTHDVRASLEG